MNSDEQLEEDIWDAQRKFEVENNWKTVMDRYEKDRIRKKIAYRILISKGGVGI